MSSWWKCEKDCIVCIHLLYMIGILSKFVHWYSEILKLTRINLQVFSYPCSTIYNQLRARRALLIFSDVPLRARRALSLYKVYGNSALLVLNGTSLNNFNGLLVPSRRYMICDNLVFEPETSDVYFMDKMKFKRKDMRLIIDYV